MAATGQGPMAVTGQIVVAAHTGLDAPRQRLLEGVVVDVVKVVVAPDLHRRLQLRPLRALTRSNAKPGGGVPRGGAAAGVRQPRRHRRALAS